MSKILAIRRENKSIWERRVAITPKEVQSLLKENSDIKIIVQPSTLRIFQDNEYEKAGAVIQEDISDAQVIFGVKEIPIEYLIPNKTFIYFSHTIKAQPPNMPALDHILKNNIRLIDYEKITDDKKQRLVAFGRFAGLAGVQDFLSGFGLFLLQKGIDNPFKELGLSYTYKQLTDIFENLKQVGKEISNGGMESFVQKFKGPLIFGMTGARGRVGQGAFEILEPLSFKRFHMEDIEKIFQEKDQWKNHIYVVDINQEHMVEHKQGKEFNKSDYYENPENYQPIFHEKYLKYISVIVNNMFWVYKYQRLITCEQMRDLVKKGQSRLLGVCDITCDYEGSIEFLRQFTDCEQPFFTYDPITEKATNGSKGQVENGILYHAMDFLPCELPFDASSHFGSKLLQFIPNIMNSNPNKPIEEQGLCLEMKNAVIASQGKLTPNFEYIDMLRQAQKKIDENQKKIKKQLSFLSYNLKGQVLTSHAFEQLSNLLMKYEIQYNFLGWKFFDHNKNQEVCLQVLSSTLDNEEFIQNMTNILNEFGIKFGQKN